MNFTQTTNRTTLENIVSMVPNQFKSPRITSCVKIMRNLKLIIECLNTLTETWPLFLILDRDILVKLMWLVMRFVTVQQDILDTRVMSLNIRNVTSISQVQLFTKDAMEQIVTLMFTQSRDLIHVSSMISLQAQRWITFFSAEPSILRESLSQMVTEKELATAMRTLWEHQALKRANSNMPL